MQDITLPERITPQDLKKLRLLREKAEDGQFTKGVHYERHLVFSISSESLHDAVTSFPRTEITCFRCGERGHKKGECRTYRTKMCRQPNDCKDVNCPFAHTTEQLRTPWVARCIRVIRSEGQLKRIGCGKTGHTFRECPYQTQPGQETSRGGRGGREGEARKPPFCQICPEGRVGPDKNAPFSQGNYTRAKRTREEGVGMFKTGDQWDQCLKELTEQEEEEARKAGAPPPPSKSGVVNALTSPTDPESLDEVAEKLAAPPKRAPGEGEERSAETK